MEESITTKEPDNQHKEAFDIVDDALEKCSVGMFHMFLLVALFFSVTATCKVTTNTAFLLTSADCDLEMSLQQKGFLNATCYAGMIVVGLMAGFLTDTFGRKRFLVAGFFSMFLTNIYLSLSQNYYMLLSGKFIEGMLSAGLTSALIAYTSEVCPKWLRYKAIIIVAMFLSVGGIMAAVIAWKVLPLDLNIETANKSFAMHSWNFYLLICGLFDFIACLCFVFLPESPKYLITIEDFQGAEKVVRKIYSFNKFRKPESLNVSFAGLKILEKNNDAKKDSFRKKILQSLLESKHILFTKRFATSLFLLSCIQFFDLLALNTIRLWYPQLSTLAESYESNHGETSNFCVMLDEYLTSQNGRATSPDKHCVAVRSGFETYKNYIIMNTVGAIAQLSVSALVGNTGKKLLLSLFFLGSSICLMALYWASKHWHILTTVAGVVSMCQINMALMQVFVVIIFPIEIRSLTLSWIMTFGRIGTLFGNIGFPMLLQLGCSVPIITIASTLFGMSILSLFLP